MDRFGTGWTDVRNVYGEVQEPEPKPEPWWRKLFWQFSIDGRLWWMSPVLFYASFVVLYVWVFGEAPQIPIVIFMGR